MRSKILFFLIAITSMVANAQIGYQVALLNNVTGEPRTNESVSVEVKITDGEGKTVCSETKSAATNEFGILSLSVGSSEVFNKVDWRKQPFFISATIDDVLIGKSQILSVPIAEYAKRTGQLTKELLKSKTWKFECGDDHESYQGTITFTDKYLKISGKYTCQSSLAGTYTEDINNTFVYEISGNSIITPPGNMIYDAETKRINAYMELFATWKAQIQQMD